MYFLFDQTNILRTLDELSRSNFFLGSITLKKPEVKNLYFGIHATSTIGSGYLALDYERKAQNGYEAAEEQMSFIDIYSVYFTTACTGTSL